VKGSEIMSSGIRDGWGETLQGCLIKKKKPFAAWSIKWEELG